MVLEEVLESADMLTLEEKEIFFDIFQKRLIEARREQIYQNSIKANEDYNKGEIIFTSDINKLKEMLEND